MHFVQPNLSAGTEVDANPVVRCAFYTDAVKLSARSFGAKLKVRKRFENDAVSKTANVIPVLEPIVGVETEEAC